MSKSLWVLAVLLIAPAYCPAQKAVLLVRHAERTAGDDLTPDGEKRAQALAQLLKDAGVTAVVRSDTVRTKKTAAPLVAAGVPEQVIAANLTHVAAAHEKIKSLGENAVVLYVGHSDTVVELMKKFGHNPTPALVIDSFDNLFVLTPKPSAPVVVRLRY